MGNLKESFDRIRQGVEKEEDEKVLYPVMKWLSADYKNIRVCQFVNKHIFYCPKKDVHRILLLTPMNTRGYYKYPKKRVEETEVMEVLKPHIKRYYDISELEYEKIRPLIAKLAKKKAFRKKMARFGGMTEEKRKKVGVEFDDLEVSERERKVDGSVRLSRF